MIAKRFNAARQSRTGKLHFFVMFCSARQINFAAASSVGNDPLVFVAFRRLLFNDSIALVRNGREIIFRISWG